MTTSVVLLVAALTPPGELQLRYVSATDAARAVTAFAEQRGLAVRIAADPSTNVVRVSGEAADRQQVANVLTALDRRPPQVTCEVLVVRAPVGFVDGAILGAAGRSTLILSAREADGMHALALRAKSAGGDILDRPRLTIIEGQTGFSQLGEAGSELVTRVTPRLTPDGKTLVQAEVRSTARFDGVQTTVGTEVTAQLESDGGLLVRCPANPTTGGRPAELLWFFRVTRVGEADTVTVCPTVIPAPISR